MTAHTAISRSQPVPQSEAEWAERLRDPWWRLTSGVLYKIMTKGDPDDDAQIGQLQPFLPNQNQVRFMLARNDFNVILKARQLGFTTLACIMGLDHALFVPNQRCGIVCQDLDKAAEFLRDKVKLAYLNLPAELRAAMPLARESAKELLFAHNNSAIRVATSMRGGTINYLHVSEMGKIAKEHPARAREIMTGSLPAVPAGGSATIESTAEGQEGDFYDIASKAENMVKAGVRPGRGQFKFHFFPWFLEPGYVSDPRNVKISPKQHEYFDTIEIETGVDITMPQRAWYVEYMEQRFAGNQQIMFQEMPSTSDEAWSKSTEGTYLTPQLDRARREGRIGNVPHLEGLPVHTFWDIGAGDGTGIWFMQQQGLASRFIRYVENWGKGYNYYVSTLRETGYVFGTMFLPHDAMQVRQLETKIGAPLDMLQELAPDWTWSIVPRVHDFQAGIEVLRQRFPEAWFDAEGCKEGLIHLSLYRKKFNSRLGQFVDEPEKQDGHSEAPDALRQWAQGFTPSTAIPGGRPGRKKARRTGMTA